MISAEGEVVEFNKIVKIEKSGQGVEIWLREVMNQMMQTLMRRIKKARDELEKTERKDWVL